MSFCRGSFDVDVLLGAYKHMSEAMLKDAAHSEPGCRADVPALPGPAGRVAVITAALVLLSVIAVSAAETAGGGEAGFHNAVLRRLFAVAVGSIAFMAGWKIPYGFWRKNSLMLLAISFLTLVLVLVPSVGSSVGGARRWIRFGAGVGFQPSDPAKFALVIWIAAWCHRCKEKGEGAMQNFRDGLLLPGMVIAAVVALMLLEPDFGTASLTAVVGFGLILIAGASVLQTGLCLLASTPVIHLLIVNSPYRMRRITTFLDPLRDVRGGGYQLIQSLAAIASGGIYGLGPGEGGIAYLPAASNDFIFSVIARQFGFIGAAVVVAAFIWLLWEGLHITIKAPDMFGSMLAAGITALICTQAAVHIAVTTGSVPTTGITMPLVSAGGSSLFFTLWSIGVLCNIALSTGRKT